LCVFLLTILKVFFFAIEQVSFTFLVDWLTKAIVFLLEQEIIFIAILLIKFLLFFWC
jgi:hypothetical protein